MNLMKSTYCWMQIFSYLSDRDIYHCDHVCQFFSDILSTDNQMVKKMFETYKNYTVDHYFWYLFKIRDLKIERLKVHSTPLNQFQIDHQPDTDDSNYLVDDIDLKLDYIISNGHLQNLKSLELINLPLCEKKENLEKLNHLEELKMIGDYVRKEQFKYLKNIKYLSIKPDVNVNVLKKEFRQLTNLVSLEISSVQFDFYILIEVLDKNYITLQNLSIHAIELDQFQIKQIIRRLNPNILQGLNLHKLRESQNYHLDALVQFKKINNIKITLGGQVDTQSFLRFLQFKNLLRASFKLCKSFNDQCLDVLVQYSPQLEKIDISQTKCTSLPVKNLFLQCSNLKKVNLASMNMLTDDFLPDENNWDRILRHCKILYIYRCPRLSGKLIKQFKKRKQYIRIYDKKQ